MLRVETVDQILQNMPSKVSNARLSYCSTNSRKSRNREIRKYLKTVNYRGLESSKSDGVYKLRMSNLFGGQYFDISVTCRNVRSLSASTKSVRLKTLDPCEPGKFFGLQ